MNGNVFFDSNVVIYAVVESDPRRARAHELLAAGGKISVQVLNEVVSVARRKVKMPWNELREILDEIQFLCPDAAPVTIDTHTAALKIAERYGYRIYDSLIVASALEAKCGVLYSEDLQDGQVINGRMRIRNPFQ